MFLGGIDLFSPPACCVLDSCFLVFLLADCYDETEKMGAFKNKKTDNENAPRRACCFGG
jgi:hypothetical protein